MNPIGINPHIMEVNADGIFYATFYLRRIMAQTIFNGDKED
jgi:hypothetical protein